MNVVLLVPVFLFSLCLHEFAHAWVAKLLGDTTAQSAGRLTLHPMAHADVFGTLILPAVCIYSGLPFIGWAKPVPVDARQFKHPPSDAAFALGPYALSNGALLRLGAVRPSYHRGAQGRWDSGKPSVSIAHFARHLTVTNRRTNSPH